MLVSADEMPSMMLSARTISTGSLRRVHEELTAYMGSISIAHSAPMTADQRAERHRRLVEARLKQKKLDVPSWKAHVLLHLQDAYVALQERNPEQLEHDIFEIGGHLGFATDEIVGKTKKRTEDMPKVEVIPPL